MRESTEDYCVACERVLPFEHEDGQSFCSVYGRTPSAARQAAKVARFERSLIGRFSRVKSSGKLWPSVLIAVIAVAVGMLLAPRLIAQATLGAIGQGIGLLMIFGPLYGGYWLYKWWRRKRED